MNPTISLYVNFFTYINRLVGGVLVRLICLRQVGSKALIAYSSVAQMGIVLSGLITITYIGICGAYTLIIAHGLCSSGLYCLSFNAGILTALSNRIGDVALLLRIAWMLNYGTGLRANYEFDLKKIIALSTLSQLGLLIRILSIGKISLKSFDQGWSEFLGAYKECNTEDVKEIKYL
uniref:NADH-ubiquinone oxidoreductase chain 4 n=1 Tax=Glossina morsitans morsitans TaxID=37546 RepID=A0A1B0G7U5_GLOMM